ncbi:MULTISPECIES: hypothetical protein [Sphingosinicellaceae]|uniref:hypothetical protein n=1 Tax=Sphingosinicellaceae TaxID=2820280 RepID=UPI001C1E5B78|nr:MULTISPECIES: hypothetical protein [Polymorphobacter]QYE33408.1 hypothetical protein KZX46_01045 [Polymorphobacter sp. PAMC 29334]UAJ12532.1 hypothetical protein KTC28_22345 [Polymorphobacter megasporae]
MMMTVATRLHEIGCLHETGELNERSPFAPASGGDLSNLLQVAASVLHLIDRQIEDDFRPLIRAGLSAISAAGAMTCSPAFAAPLRYSLEG